MNNSDKEVYYSFPTLKDLSGISENELREMGLGYRASYIVRTIEMLEVKGGENFLLSLREKKSVEDRREALLEFKGIGNKVADCISLFSLDATNLIPIDTHVF